MKIVYLTDWHSEKMGYSDNFLPKALANLGHEVHLVSSDGQVYFNTSFYEKTFKPFLGPAIVGCGIKKINGFTLHRLAHVISQGKIRLPGLFTKLKQLKPDIVQAGEYISVSTKEAALFKPILKYKFFVECHIHASVFPLAKEDWYFSRWLYWLLFKYTSGWFISLMSEKIYPISSDAADIAIRFLGAQPEKVVISPLGVDTDLFRPLQGKSSLEKRTRLRKKYGFLQSDIVCVYTGRIDNDKNPLCLAKVIGILVKDGLPFRGFFIGNGSKKDIEVILANPGCKVHPLVPVHELPSFYWLADIAVWPAQESTSQLDAMACGLPIILNDKIKVKERVKGNGLLYKENNAQDLMRKILLLESKKIRLKMGNFGAEKIKKHYSWQKIAKDYVKDYEKALQSK